MVPDGSIAREMLFIRLTNGRSIFGRPRLACQYRLFCVGLRCRGVVMVHRYRARIRAVRPRTPQTHPKYAAREHRWQNRPDIVRATPQQSYEYHLYSGTLDWSTSSNRRLSFTINRVTRNILRLERTDEMKHVMYQFALVYHPLRGIKVQSIN